MAKKVVATLKTGTNKKYTKCIKMVKSEKTGAYVFKEQSLLEDGLSIHLAAGGMDSDGSTRLPDGKCDRKCSQHAQ